MRNALPYIGRAEGRGVVWIDPRKVTHYAGSKHAHYHRLLQYGRIGATLRVLQRRAPFLALEGDWDLKAIPLELEPKYLNVSDYVAHYPDFRSSRWYAEYAQALARKGSLGHKKFLVRSTAELDRLFEDYIAGLHDSLRDKGYVQLPGVDIGSAVVDREGRLMKVGSGTHRFFFARELGVSPVPLVVRFVHILWLERLGITLDPADRDRLVDAVEDVGRRYA